MLTTWVVIWQRVALTIYPHVFSSTRHSVVPANQNIWIGTSYLESSNCREDRSDKQRMRNSCVTKYCDTSDIERENDTPHPSQHLHGEMPNAVIRNIAKWIDIRIHYGVVAVYQRLFHLIAPCVSLFTLYRVSGTTHERPFINLRFSRSVLIWVTLKQPSSTIVPAPVIYRAPQQQMYQLLIGNRWKTARADFSWEIVATVRTDTVSLGCILVL